MFEEPFARDILALVPMRPGRNNLSIRAETGSIALLPKLPCADLPLLHNCGHSIAIERRAAFLSAGHTLCS
jgi:hypothetical protein